MGAAFVGFALLSVTTQQYGVGVRDIWGERFYLSRTADASMYRFFAGIAMVCGILMQTQRQQDVQEMKQEREMEAQE